MSATGEEFRDDTRRLRGLAPATVKRLSRLDPLKATLAVAETWGVIALAVAAALLWWHPVVIALAVVVIGSRQQALFVLAHDAAQCPAFRTACSIMRSLRSSSANSGMRSG